MLEVKWKEWSICHSIFLARCFNPCYVGSKMERLNLVRLLPDQNNVSILVMLEVKWKDRSYFFRKHTCGVSILVMLEVKWKEHLHHIIRQRHQVSILVMLEVKWKAVIQDGHHLFTNSFNPCYVGSKMERIYDARSLSSPNCFNPCYVGSKMERTFLPLNPSASVKFQSLLCWK